VSVHLEVTVYYTNGTAMTQPHPHQDTKAGRVATDKKVFRLLAEPKVKEVKVVRTDRIAGDKKGKAR
jgi:hypothetical protein